MSGLSLRDVFNPRPITTVLMAQSDPAMARALWNDLHAHFAGVVLAENASEVRTLVLRHPEVRMAVLDMEVVGLEDVRELAHTFSELIIVCTHRSPDDRMWTAALAAGAVEYCHPDDIRAILRAQTAA
jgi:DNA-binding NtrC family response regulator